MLTVHPGNEFLAVFKNRQFQTQKCKEMENGLSSLRPSVPYLTSHFSWEVLAIARGKLCSPNLGRAKWLWLKKDLTQGRSGAVIPENILSGQIKNAAIEEHKVLGGPGLLESIYEGALFQEILVRRQIHLLVTYKGIKMHDPLRLDLLVGEKLIIEVKAVEQNSALHKAQLLTYLRLTNLKLGLVLNFYRQPCLMASHAS